MTNVLLKCLVLMYFCTVYASSAEKSDFDVLLKRTFKVFLSNEEVRKPAVKHFLDNTLKRKDCKAACYSNELKKKDEKLRKSEISCLAYCKGIYYN